SSGWRVTYHVVQCLKQPLHLVLNTSLKRQLSPMVEPHPVWGRSIEDYATTYELDSFLQELVPNATQVPGTTFFVIPIDPIRFVNEISKIGEEHDEVQIKSLAKNVNLEKLKAILEITSTRQYFVFMHNPLLVPGCIKLMAVMDTMEEQSLFKYEYGYLCFRIISIFLSIFLSEKPEEGDTDGVIGVMKDFPEDHPLAILDRVAEIISRLEFNSACEAPEAEKAAKLVTLIPLQTASTLFKLVWVNRKLWFKALSATYTPGLPAVMLLFWQVWSLASLNSPDDTHDPLGVWLYDILRRCCLVCTSDQEMAVRSMMYDVRKLSGQWWNLGGERWKYGPLVDAEDSKAIIRAYLRRLKPTNSTGWKVPDMILVYHLIEFVAGFVVPE
ncbi:unnamed protein product, partial [Rhizoctonia solani]